MAFPLRLSSLPKARTGGLRGGVYGGGRREQQRDLFVVVWLESNLPFKLCVSLAGWASRGPFIHFTGSSPPLSQGAVGACDGKFIDKVDQMAQWIPEDLSSTLGPM